MSNEPRKMPSMAATVLFAAVFAIPTVMICRYLGVPYAIELLLCCFIGWNSTKGLIFTRDKLWPGFLTKLNEWAKK